MDSPDGLPNRNSLPKYTLFQGQTLRGDPVIMLFIVMNLSSERVPKFHAPLQTLVTRCSVNAVKFCATTLYR